jgi:uncharacterized protein (DUF58 family)
MSTDLKSRFLEIQLLTALEHMRFSTRQRIEGVYSGRHQSRQRGGAGEFADYREYSAGEDLRRLDWKVLGRTGKAYIRLFQDEKNLLCTLAIDTSSSMKFGERSESDLFGSKIEYGQYLMTSLSHMIGRGQDQVGLALLNDGLSEYLPPGGTLSHLTQVQHAIEQLELSASTQMKSGIERLFEHSRARSVLMFFSDFLFDDLEETFSALRLFRHRQSEVVILHVIHPGEERLPAGTAYRFEGLENDGNVECSPAEIQRDYQQRFQAHVDSVRNLSLSNGCDYLRISTTVPYLQTLGEFLVERAG